MTQNELVTSPRQLPDGAVQTVTIFEQSPVRVIWQLNGRKLVVSKDVAIALHYANTHQAINLHVSAKDRGVYQIYPP